MKWIIVLIAGFVIGAFTFVPKFREIVLEIVLGDMIVRVCPGDNGVILNGSLQLPNYAREDLTAVCDDWTAKFKNIAEEAEKTSWSEYLTASVSGPATIAMLEAETFLNENNWTKTREGGDDEVYKAYFEKDDKKIVIYTLESVGENNYTLFITGN